MANSESVIAWPMNFAGTAGFLGQRRGRKAQTIYESEMALFNECMQSCARIVLDTADIVRDGDLSPSVESFRVTDHSGVNSDKVICQHLCRRLPCGSCCGSRFSLGGWRRGVQILFLQRVCCIDDGQNIGSHVV